MRLNLNVIPPNAALRHAYLHTLYSWFSRAGDPEKQFDSVYAYLSLDTCPNAIFKDLRPIGYTFACDDFEASVSNMCDIISGNGPTQTGA